MEAKAHSTELLAVGKKPGNEQNEQSIRAAIAEANKGFGGQARGWHLTADNHYQLCNRFAWAWKVASLGVPVVLVYLGFLNADEMGADAFHSVADWDNCLRNYADGVVPGDAWNYRLAVRSDSGALVPSISLIQTAQISWRPGKMKD